MLQQKKKILFVSNYCSAKTGFAGAIRKLLTFLYKLNSFELCLLGAGMPFKDHQDFQRWPWKCYGTIPNDQNEINRMNADQNYARDVNYGSWAIDKVVEEFRPDIIVFVEDPWSINGYEQKSFWGKVTCIVHTTLDSLPILDRAVELAKLTPYFFSWANFATKEMNKMGLDNVKTMPGTPDTYSYKKLPVPIKQELRTKHNIPIDAFVMGMVFRNQLRKTSYSLVEGYRDFKRDNPSIKTRLILATHFSEGWDLPKLIKEYGIDPSEVLAVYKCRKTMMYFVAPFQGQDLNNPITGDEKTLITINPADGITEEQLNEVYNLMDVYVHPVSSGGFEIPNFEAKLCELITLVTNYSCGEDLCVPEAASFPLDWAPYREPGSQFIKATTLPSSIVKQLNKVLKMDQKTRAEWGKKARKWVLDNFSIEVVGKKWEELFDSLPYTSWDFKPEQAKPANPDAQLINYPDNAQFVHEAYSKILMWENIDMARDDLQGWVNSLNQGMPRQQFLQAIVSAAHQHNSKIQTEVKHPLEQHLGAESADDRILVTLPESLGDLVMATSLMKDIRENNPNKVIYFATKPEFFDVLRPVPYIDKIIPYDNYMDNAYGNEGNGYQTKYFHAVIPLHFGTQRMIDYLRGGDDTSKIDLTYK